MIWFDAVFTTLLLCLLTSLVSIGVGTVTAVSAWWSNKSWAYYTPLFLLALPPWLLSYQLSDQFGYIDPLLGATLSLGLICSVYSHSLIASSLSNRAYSSWEMMSLCNGRNLYSLWTAIYPSIKISILPSLAIVFAEVIADFGVSNFYGINTVTMLTYNIWTSTWSMINIMTGIIILCFMGILISRMDLKSSMPISASNRNTSDYISGLVSILPATLILGFSIFKSLQWYFFGASFIEEDFFKELYNTFYLLSIVLVVCVSIMLIYMLDFRKRFLETSGIAFYALPGTVIGAVYLYAFGSYIPLMILLSVAIITRYYGLMTNCLATADKGNQKYFEVISFYTKSTFDKVKNKFKLILPSSIIGICLITLDVLRELPISMILQPMNFQTLAMRMDYIARNEAIPNLGPHSLVLLVLSFITTAILIRLVYVVNKKFK
jgi:iron(III) transport system permease protein